MARTEEQQQEEPVMSLWLIRPNKPTPDLIKLDSDLSGKLFTYVKYLKSGQRAESAGLAVYLFALIGLGFIIYFDILPWTTILVMAWWFFVYGIYNLFTSWQTQRAERVLAERLFQLLQHLRHGKLDLSTISKQRVINVRLGSLARASERIPVALRTRNSSLVHRAGTIAAGYRSLQVWASEPQATTLADLTSIVQDNMRHLVNGKWHLMYAEEANDPVGITLIARLIYGGLALVAIGGLAVVGLYGTAWGIGQGISMTILAVLSLSLLSKAGLELALVGNAQGIISGLK